MIANAIGGGLSAALNLLLIPIALRQLGLEAYGVIAFLASTQVFLSLFDIGLSPAITWAMASTGDIETQRRSIRGVWSPYVLIGVLLGTAVVLTAPFLAASWLQLTELSRQEATTALSLGGIAVALRWPVSLLSGILAGLQRFDYLNLAKGLHAVASFLGAVTVLSVFPGIVPFALWLAISALVEVSAYRVAVQRAIPRLPLWPFGPAGTAPRVWRYARGVAVIAALSLLLTQADRVVIAKTALASDLGRYSVAYALVFGLSLIPLFVTTAYYPRLVADHSEGEMRRFADRYRDASQVLIYLYSLPFSVLTVLGSWVLNLIAAPASSTTTVVVLALLSVGFWLNTSAALAYVAALATANTRLPIIINAFNVLWYLPVLVVAALSFGIIGVAAGWVLLNASYLLTLIPAVHRRILGEPVVPWLIKTLIPFPLLACATLLAARLVLTESEQNPIVSLLGFVVASAAYLVIGWCFLGRRLQTSTPLAGRLVSRP